MKLIITEEVIQTMQRHAEATFPNECCGFFYGQDNEERQVNEVRPVDNSQDGDQRRRFEISAFDYMKAEKYASDQDTTLLGIYHSHPNHPAKPSEHDLKQAVPFFSYIIISVMDGKSVDITSWQLNQQQQFEEESIKNLSSIKS